MTELEKAIRDLVSAYNTNNGDCSKFALDPAFERPGGTWWNVLFDLMDNAIDKCTDQAATPELPITIIFVGKRTPPGGSTRTYLATISTDDCNDIEIKYLTGNIHEMKFRSVKITLEKKSYFIQDGSHYIAVTD